MSGVKNLSFWAILSGNAFAVYLALTQHWSLMEILWVYWGQSVIIGCMAFWRMWNLTDFSTEGLTSNGNPIPETKQEARRTAIFFTFHYGIFHTVYLVFLLVVGFEFLKESAFDWRFVIVAIAAFFISHLTSLIINVRPDLESPRPNLGTIMGMPYLRIIPMHITIIFGMMLLAEGMTKETLLLFMGLKTLFDAITHLIEHHIMQRNNETPESATIKN